MHPFAPVAQLDRVPDYESGGRTFESYRARQISREYMKASSNGWGFFVSGGFSRGRVLVRLAAKQLTPRCTAPSPEGKNARGNGVFRYRTGRAKFQERT